MSNQLIKNTEQGIEKIFPKNYIQNLIDKDSGKNLQQILNSFNMLFLSYAGNKAETRKQVPLSLRKQGLWITYVIGKTVVIEWYNSNAIDDNTWGSSTYWMQGSNTLVGDITISSQGTWVVNGEDTGISPKGDKGDSPLIRIYNNKIQVSYDKGVTYQDLNNTPVYTKFRFNSWTNTYQVSYDLEGTWQDISNEKVYHKFRYNNSTNTYQESIDLGKTWSNISAEKVYYQFRTNDNRLQVSTDLGTTWGNCSEPIAAWFRWANASGIGNIGKIQISRDQQNWEDLSPTITNNLYIKGYVSTVGELPTSSADIGDIYMVGPTYDESDTTQKYPHYRMWVKQSSGWVDTGEFLSVETVSSYQDTDPSKIGSAKTHVMTHSGNIIKPMTDFNSVFDANGRSLTEFESGIYDVLAARTNRMSELTSGYINSGTTGTLDETVIEASNYVHGIWTLKAGTHIRITGTGGTGPRLWSFWGAGGVLIKRSAVDASATDLELTVPADYPSCKFVFNAVNDKSHNIAISIDDLINQQQQDDEINTIKESSTIYKEQDVNGYGYIKANVATLDTTPVVDGNYRYALISCSFGDKFRITGTGSDASRVWSLWRSGGQRFDFSLANQTVTNLVINIPYGVAYLLVNVNINTPYKVEKLGVVSTGELYPQVISNTNTVEQHTKNITLLNNITRIDEVIQLAGLYPSFPVNDPNYSTNDDMYYNTFTKTFGRYLNGGTLDITSQILSKDLSKTLFFSKKDNSFYYWDGAFLQLYNNDAIEDVVFYLQHELDDVSNDIQGIDFSRDGNILTQVYAKFDALVSNYADFVTRSDAAVDADISYPSYADYNMYCYKFISHDSSIGHDDIHKKKKLLIISGVHGNEIAAPVNAYLFAKRLCESTLPEYFYIRTYYDVYIIPVVNGWGTINRTRYNHELVDLNRNFASPGWVAGTGEYEGVTYTYGDSAGSEFETQVIQTLLASLKPDIFIDHHNYGNTAGQQFYCETETTFLTKCFYHALCDCSKTFIAEHPEYFGAKYKLVTTGTGRVTPTVHEGTSYCYGYRTANNPFSTVIEIGQCINYNNGEPTSSMIDNYGNDTFAIAEYTLRSCICRLCEYYLHRQTNIRQSYCNKYVHKIFMR